jgi:DNA-binding transcriptional LysR family regulator
MKIENTSDLRVLVQTARGGTLTAAAHALGITPAAASATLKRLEAQLGARLFERSTRAMRLTPQGQTLLDYAVRAFELLDEGESLVTADRGALVGTVRVASPSDLTRSTLLPWFDEFLALHAGVQLSLSVGDRPLDVMRDEVDVALRYGALADSRLVARPFAMTNPVLTASPDYLRHHAAPKTPQDLAQHNCLTFNRAGRRHRIWRFAQNGQWTEVRVNGDRSVDDASLAREWARGRPRHHAEVGARRAQRPARGPAGAAAARVGHRAVPAACAAAQRPLRAGARAGASSIFWP